MRVLVRPPSRIEMLEGTVSKLMRENAALAVEVTRLRTRLTGAKRRALARRRSSRAREQWLARKR